MKEIIKNKSKFEIKSVNAIIKDNTIIPGIKGKEVDLEKTYTKMKQYGTYNEALTVFKETKPTISIEDNYDKLITSGNKENKNIALIFKLEKNTNLDKLLSILNYYNIQTTFFIDGLYIENNNLNNLSNHQIELLSYNNTIDEILLSNGVYDQYGFEKTNGYFTISGVLPNGESFDFDQNNINKWEVTEIGIWDSSDETLYFISITKQ